MANNNIINSMNTMSLDDPIEPERNKSRKDYLKWNDYFMALAFLAAQRSKDPCTQVGACIVNSDNRIVGMGYNGMPTGCDDNEFPWGKSDSNINHKSFYVCHAEMNAVLNKNSYDLKNCRIYVGLFPCNECAKVIIQSGIREVIYLSDRKAHKLSTQASKRMFDASGVKYWQYTPEKSKIVIDFSQDMNSSNQIIEEKE
ncbi:hypothetical protein O3M35_004805 [Rhynocoris fuscipes]|uniref:Probable deoxycytidylate deaminase n=1 Tax=Rhynocoris fuscipes TaxID=488301 RepID=A0AAW1DI77_9HEMI